MEGTKVGSIFVHSLKTTSRYCSSFIAECYSDSGLTTRVGVATSAVVWDGTYWQQKSLISFGGLIKGNTYYLRAGVVAPGGGAITWSSSYSVAATNGTAPTTTYAAVYDVISTGVSYTVTPTGVPSDINHFEVYYNFTGTAPGSTTVPQFRLPFIYVTDTTFHFFVSCKAGTSVYAWVRAYNTSGQTQAWTALTSKTAVVFGGTLDDVPDGSSFAKVSASALSSGQIASIQGHPVASATPSTNQALVWNGSTYTPTTVVGTGGGTASGALTGDVTKVNGSTACTVVAIQGLGVTNTGPTDGQVLTWVAADNLWEPKTPTGGSSTGTVVAKTANYTILSGDNGNTFTFSGTNLTATMPSSAPASPWMVVILNLANTPLTVARNGRNINGGANNIILGQYESIIVWSDGSNYFVGGDQPNYTEPSDAQVWSYSTSTHKWAPTSLSALGGANASQIRGVNINTKAPHPGDALVFNGTDWVPQLFPLGTYRVVGHCYDGGGTGAANFTNLGTTSNCIVSSTFTVTLVAPTSTEPPMLQAGNSNTGSTNTRGFLNRSILPRFGFFGTLVGAQWRVRVDQTANTRYWLAMTDTTNQNELGSSIMATDTPAQNVIGFRYSSGVTNWQAYCGTDATHQTVVDTGVAPDTSHSQLFEFKQDGSSVYFYINGTLVATISTNVPASSNACGLSVLADNKNTANNSTFAVAWTYEIYSK